MIHFLECLLERGGEGKKVAAIWRVHELLLETEK